MKYYEITIENHIDNKRLRDFEGMALKHQPEGTTMLYGELADQAALFSVLNRIRDMNLTLISVNDRRQS